MAKLESGSCCAEIRFFVKYDTFLTCEVFLRLSAGGQVFPDTQRFRNIGGRLATEHGLDPAEWWRGWDLGGAAYVDWIERALAGETSNLEPTEEYHFGVITPRYGSPDDPPEDRSFLFVLGIDTYCFINDPEVCIGGETGPALCMSVDAVQLMAFRDEMLKELEPQWRQHVKFDTWRNLP